MSYGGGDSGCGGGGDYSGNDGGCDSSHDVGTSHDNSSHSHTNDGHSSHVNTHYNHSSTAHCLPTYEESVKTVHGTTHNNDRHSEDDKVSAHYKAGNNGDDPNYDYHHQVNLLNSNHTSIDVYDRQNNFIPSTRNIGWCIQARPNGSKFMRRRQISLSTGLMIAFVLFAIAGLIILVACSTKPSPRWNR